MKQNVKLILAYDGTNYKGWQKQGNTTCTIQGELERAIFSSTGSRLEIQGSGRTDAGVHAKGQVANFFLKSKLDERNLLLRINEQLPEDIRVKEVAFVERDFHARLSAVGKQYVYQLWNDDTSPVFERKYCYQITEPLDMEAMKKASNYFMGTHDFRSFTSDKNWEKSTVRNIERIEFIQTGKKLSIHYEGEGFLYNMVRIMTGTLIEVGLHKRSVASVKEALSKEDRQMAGFTAPPQGLILQSVRY